MGKIQSLQTRRAQRLRRRETRAEAILWEALRAHRLGGWKWRRQAPFGPFIRDLLCVEAGLVVEVDGGVRAEPPGYDARRTAYLAAHGLRVLRVSNDDVLADVARVGDRILQACGGPRASPG